ncbi:hypothetical protein HME9304_03124 [Flagellimonas maritima]|uniref:Uncharacterized protein n=2 Tax=Flagellimonas maritima TaxID=1383885 RepID=A0A2Z4LWC2_9FLAO|nr:hypothetical protein HME9304_03124 [Allomuricauda aurantiaca]
MGFEEYNPKPTLVVSENPKERAKYTFIDVHSHQFQMATQNLTGLITDMDKMNMGVMVNLSGGSGQGLRAMLKNVNDNYPNRFVIFANVDFNGVGNSNWGEQAAAQLELDVKTGAKGLKIYKSLGLRNKDINGNRIAIDDPRLNPIWEKCAELAIPVLIHAADPKSFWDPMDKNNERWLELKTRPRRKRSNSDPAPWQQIIDEQHRMFKNIQILNLSMHTWAGMPIIWIS